MSFGKVILGDNQFLGVNHASQAKAIEQFERFKDSDAILEVIGFAYNSGVRDFMFTTHDRYEDVFEEIRRSNMFPGMYYTPCLPYAHKYWNKISDMGPVAALSSTLFKINILSLVPAALGLVIGSTKQMTQVLTEIEILMCKGLPVRGVFLQNLAFDFLMAMELNRVVEDFATVVADRLGAHPGFITMNHPIATEFLCDIIGLNKPWVCSNYNVNGFRMNPSQTACEVSFASRKTRNIAMSVLASGRASPCEAMNYATDSMRKGDVDAIVFGSSSRINIVSNVSQILG
jgi:hypothetical protein